MTFKVSFQQNENFGEKKKDVGQLSLVSYQFTHAHMSYYPNYLLNP